MEIKNKIVIVTGASSGIGEATARLLAKKGAKVALVARSKDKLEALSKQLPDSFVCVADLTKKDQIEKMVKKVHAHYGRIDILINNAGRGYDAPVADIAVDKLQELFVLDFIGPLLTMQKVIPIMRKQGGGTIVNISSGTSLMYIPNMAAYSSIKRALNGMSLTAREELKKDNITVSVVYPYITATDFDKNMIGAEEFTVHDGDFAGDLPPIDPPEYVAEKILEVIKSGNPRQFAHEWMKER